MKEKRNGPDETAVVAGRKPVLEFLVRSPDKAEAVFLQQGVRGEAVSQILDICRTSGIRFSNVPRRELDRLVGSSSHQGVAARIFPAGFVSLDEVLTAAASAPLPLVLVLDQVQDVGNVGALARTMWAMGGGGLVLPRHGSARLGPAAVKRSAGALELLPVAQVTNLGRALETSAGRGYVIYGADAGEARSVFAGSLDLPGVLVLGSEDAGIRPGVLKRCHKRIYVPMAREFDSLNVAQAGAVIIGQFARGYL
jgi:23S rRNA (guanosine2251-2'-O)-methyltransferase